ncbi:hypothetical protein [Albimonas pacifica]|uniref:DUF4136 domain-containing protein n=1 Tax=Albimonas pacifica TaxID=1114924 RepID=A0A1I3DUT2_9RHOB|nr:hypothetical protein [Albimonas pacifica]SFH90241.1 hypothetical protein SAMN05216258_10315 [Albimonas pacifica]
MTSRRAACLLLPLLLAGCAGAGVVSQVDRSPGSADQVRAFLASRPVISVAGTPPDGAGPEAVAGALRAPASEGGGGFSLAAPGADPRLAVGFGAASPDALCAGAGGAGGGSATGELRATVAWCVDGAARGSARVSSGAVLGPSSPGFADLFASAFSQMARQRRSGGDGAG